MCGPQAVERLNLKPRNMRDLVTDEPFTRTDLVTLQDPTNLGKFDMTSFHHLQNSLRVGEEGMREQVCTCVCESVLWCQRKNGLGGSHPTT